MKTILFDLDGTLLPMNQEEFIKAYLGGLATKLLPYGYDPNQLINAIWTGTKAMVINDGTETNETRFWQAFEHIIGEDVRKDEPLFDDFYRNEFQQVKAVCGFMPEAKDILEFCRSKGLRVILATSPLYPRVATESRIRWAGLQPEDFDFITTYEDSHYCKPNPDYYREICEKIGVAPENCLMIGNDEREDMKAASEAGFNCFLVTDCRIMSKHFVWTGERGSFEQALHMLERL